MSRKHLHELLKEEQEPFLVHNYIANKRLQLNRSHNLDIKKAKLPISQTATDYFLPHKCFLLSLSTNSPDPKRSPLLSPIKSPSSNPIFLQIPAKTAALLLEAALRIQKQSTNAKNKTQVKNLNGFGLVGSLFKRLITHRNENRKSSCSDKYGIDNKQISDVGCSCSHNGSLSSAVWSERSLDCDTETSISTSSTCISSQFQEHLFGENHVTDFNDKQICESPFHFVLRQSPASSGQRTPDFSSPATSPRRFNVQEKEINNSNNYVDGLNKFEVELEEEEEKEQLSPVSVLDPTFEDDDDDDHHDGDDQSEHNDFDHDCSYAIVQRTKKNLLQKLRRFEKLAELDPIELENRIIEQDHDAEDDNNDINVDEELVTDESLSIDNDNNIIKLIIEEVIAKSSLLHSRGKFPGGMSKLVFDLIEEERREQNFFVDDESIVKRVCKRLESWKGVEFNTIDMMVEKDYKRELDEWKRNKRQVTDLAIEIELGIFGLLMEELSQELLGFTGI